MEHAQRREDAPLLKRKQRPARRELRDPPGNDIVQVRIAEPGAGREQQRVPAPFRDDAVGRGRSAARSCGVALRIVVGQARHMLQQLAHRDPAGIGDLRQPAGDGCIERQRAVRGEQQQRLRGDRLGGRGELVARVGGGGPAWRDGREPERLGVDHLPMLNDGDRGRGRAVLGQHLLDGSVDLAGERRRQAGSGGDTPGRSRYGRSQEKEEQAEADACRHYVVMVDDRCRMSMPVRYTRRSAVSSGAPVNERLVPGCGCALPSVAF